MIKAIETVYKGYRFRSRLEARWAVFFDALGVKWEYEKEGYQLKSGWYLPDFWLPDFNFFVEIKPSSQGVWEHSSGVYDQVNDKCIFPVVLICGEPGDYTAIDYREFNDDKKWACCPKCKCVDFVFDGWAGYIKGCSCFGFSKLNHKTSGIDSPGMIRAITAARSARFEHGETPSVK